MVDIPDIYRCDRENNPTTSLISTASLNVSHWLLAMNCKGMDCGGPHTDHGELREEFRVLRAVAQIAWGAQISQRRELKKLKVLKRESSRSLEWS